MKNRVVDVSLRVLVSSALVLGSVPTNALAEGIDEAQNAAEVLAEGIEEAQYAAEALAAAVSADSDYIVDWTECGTCVWSIDSNGALVVKPADGNETGELTEVPWSSYRSKVKSVKFEGTVKAPSNFDYAFRDMTKLEAVDFSGLDTSGTKSIRLLFDSCYKLSYLDLSGLDFSSVNDMMGAFNDCLRLRAIDFSDIDTGSVTDMRQMFYGCSSLSSLDLSGFDTSSLGDMSLMFYGCSSLGSLDLSDIDTSSVKLMTSMFSGCSSLVSLDLSDFDVSNVTDMNQMFYGCSALQSLTLFKGDLSCAKSLDLMFYYCSSLTSLDFSGFDISSVTDMGAMFYGCSSLTSLDLSSFDTSNVTDMSVMFYGCSSLTSLDLSSFDTSIVTDMSNMFELCSALERIDLGHNFSFCGAGSVRLAYLPGEVWWSTAESKSYDLNEIPNNVSTTYIKAKHIQGAEIEVSDQVYSGSSLTPEVSVTFGGETLAENEDYVVEYKDNLNAGTGKVIVTGLALYTGTAEATFDIAPKSIALAEVAASGQIYSGDELTPSVEVKLGGAVLVEGIDYEVSYSNNVNAGIASVVVEGKGNYTGTAKGSFDISSVDASNASVEVDDQAWSGSPLTPAAMVTLDGKELEEGVDYDLSYANNINAGNATASVSFKGNYSGSAQASFAINTVDASYANVEVADQVWTGDALTPDLVVTLDGHILKQGVDFDASYSDNVNVGTAKVRLSFKGNCTGSAETTFEISAVSISSASVTAPDQAYTGDAHEPVVKVTLGEKTLVQGVDYEVSYESNVNGGTATVTVTGKGGYAGSAKGTFNIAAADASKAVVKIDDQSWTGSAVTPDPVVTFGGKTLVQGIDYDVTYTQNTAIGTASFTVTFKGNYGGTAKGTFQIKAAEILSASVSVARQTYAGSALEPAVTVRMGERTLAAGTDYDVAYSDNVNAGTATVIVTAKGNYSGTKTSTFTIDPADASKAEVKVADQTYSGDALAPEPSVSLGNKVLVKGTDYDVSYSDNTSAGTATAAVTFKGNYSGTAKGAFAIKAADASKAEVNAADQLYTGTSLTPAPTVTLNGKALEQGVDYDVSYSDNVDAGSANVSVAFKGNYSGKAKGTFQIKAAEILSASVSVARQTYSGSALEPAVTVRMGERTLAAGMDYDVSYSNNVNAGTAAVTVTAKGNYSGSKTSTFTIDPADASKAEVTVADQTYSGDVLAPEPSVSLGNKVLVKGTDYDVLYADNTNAGTATAAVTFKGNYTGTAKASFSIKLADASKAEVKVADQTWTGAALTPAPAVSLNGRVLSQGTDYTVSFSDNTNLGTAAVTVAFMGNYSGSAKGTFQIKAIDASKAEIKVADQAYNGSALTPAPTVTLGGKTLKQGSDYTVAYANNTNAGTATVTVTFKGNYTGTAKGTFAIKAVDASKATVRLADQTYTGKPLTPAPTVTLAGKTLVSGTDYDVSYSNNVKAGTATATVTFKGNYSGTAKGTFKISSASVTYQAHVQDIGWQAAVKDGATAGTSGQAKRVEALKVSVENAGCTGSIQIRAHVQDIGWQGWSTTGGTTGLSKRVEAMQLRLTGELAERYDVYYRVHAENIGWMGWAKNGESAGTEGYSLRLEAIQVVLVPKGGAAPGATSDHFRKPSMSVAYQAHVQDIGWQAAVRDGAVAGTSGQAKRVEALAVSIEHPDYAGGIQIRAHVQDIGWQGWSTTGGTTGQSKRVEAMQLRLTGELAEHYDVYYRVHAQNIGWMGWAKNGESAGTEGMALRLEAIQVKLVPKGAAAPGSTANCFQKR